MLLLISVLFVLTGGVFSSLQSPTNAELSKYIGNFQASLVSFSGGVIALAALVLLLGDGDMSRLGEAEWWQVIGGLYGSYFVLMATFIVPVLGVALAVTAISLGQLLGGTVIDAFGLFRVEATPVSPLRMAGLIIVAAGVFLVYTGKKADAARAGASADGGQNGRTLLYMLLAFSVGLGSAVQSPTNTSLAAVIGKVEASLVNFIGGFIIILAATLITSKGRLQPMRGRQEIRPWMLTGGLYGAFCVFATIFATPYLGVALLMSTNNLGQLAGGMLVDSFGLARTRRIKMNGFRYAGMAVIAVGVVMVACAKAM